MLEPYRETLGRYHQAIPTRDDQALTSWLSTFYPFQLDWVLDQERFAAVNKSRQIGMSHSTAAVSVLWGAFHGELTTVISKGERESAEVLDKCKKHRQVLVEMGSEMARGGRLDAKTGFDFVSGGRVLALPSSGGRSFTGNVFLDEFAYQEHADEVWDAAVAVTMLGNFRCRVASTPNGVGNEFYHLMSDPVAHRGWSLHDVTIHRAIEQGFPVSLDDCWKIAKGDPRLFAQLFECKFLDAQDQYLPTAVVEACQYNQLPENLEFPFGYYGGLDVGRDNDLTVMAVVGVDANRCAWLLSLESCKRTDSDLLRELVDRTVERYQLEKLRVDQTGIGIFPVDEMIRRHGAHMVEGIDFTLKSKDELATGLLTGFSKKSLAIPRRDGSAEMVPAGEAGALFRDLCSIRREITTAGNVRYDAPRTQQGHADRAWALALAVKGLSDLCVTSELFSIPNRF